MKKLKLLSESFNSIHSYLKTINSRTNNPVMATKNSSVSGTFSFTHTESYDEATKLITQGWSEKVPIIKKGLRKNQKIFFQNLALPKNLPSNAPVGYIPNVPNALINLPNSMIHVEKKPQKRKTLSITYIISGNCNKSIEFFVNAGISLVTAINIIEAHGIQSKLEVANIFIECEEVVLPKLLIKNFGERFDLQKICFPLINPSMVRRFGFKYLETCPKLTNTFFSFAYGHSPRDKNEWCTMKQLIGENTNNIIITTDDINDLNCDVTKILDFFKFSTKG